MKKASINTEVFANHKKGGEKGKGLCLKECTPKGLYRGEECTKKICEEQKRKGFAEKKRKCGEESDDGKVLDKLRRLHCIVDLTNDDGGDEEDKE